MTRATTRRRGSGRARRASIGCAVWRLALVAVCSGAPTLGAQVARDALRGAASHGATWHDAASREVTSRDTTRRDAPPHAASPRARPALVVHATASVGAAPSRVFGSIVDRRVPSLVLEWRQPLVGDARRGVAWAPALHPVLGMSRVPTRDAAIFYDCASAFDPGSERAPCPAQWSARATAWAVAVEPLAARLHHRVGPASVSVRPGIGVASFVRAVPIPEGRRLNALLRLDAALEWPVAARTQALVQAGYWHISNAGTAPLNPGVDALQLSLGLTRAIGRR